MPPYPKNKTSFDFDRYFDTTETCQKCCKAETLTDKNVKAVTQ